MSNRSAAKAQAITESFKDAEAQEAAVREVKKARTQKVQRRLEGRHKLDGALEAASNYGYEDPTGVKEGGTWEQSVIDAQHEQLNASASDHYHAALDRFHTLKSVWSAMVATVWIFGNTPAVPSKFNWTKLIEMTPFRNDGGGDPAFSNPDLLGYETAEEANEWREQASDLFLTIVDLCWAYLKGEVAEENGVKVSPLNEDGSFGPYTEVALLFEFAGFHCQAFATMDSEYPGGWEVSRIDIGNKNDNDGFTIWDEEEDLILIERYQTIREQHDKANRLQWNTAQENRRRQQAEAMTARREKRNGLVT